MAGTLVSSDDDTFIDVLNSDDDIPSDMLNDIVSTITFDEIRAEDCIPVPALWLSPGENTEKRPRFFISEHNLLTDSDLELLQTNGAIDAIFVEYYKAVKTKLSDKNSNSSAAPSSAATGRRTPTTVESAKDQKKSEKDIKDTNNISFDILPMSMLILDVQYSMSAIRKRALAVKEGFAYLSDCNTRYWTWTFDEQLPSATWNFIDVLEKKQITRPVAHFPKEVPKDDEVYGNYLYSNKYDNDLSGYIEMKFIKTCFIMLKQEGQSPVTEKVPNTLLHNFASRLCMLQTQHNWNVKEFLSDWLLKVNHDPLKRNKKFENEKAKLNILKYSVPDPSEKGQSLPDDFNAASKIEMFLKHFNISIFQIDLIEAYVLQEFWITQLIWDNANDLGIKHVWIPKESSVKNFLKQKVRNGSSSAVAKQTIPINTTMPYDGYATVISEDTLKEKEDYNKRKSKLSSMKHKDLEILGKEKEIKTSASDHSKNYYVEQILQAEGKSEVYFDDNQQQSTKLYSTKTNDSIVIVKDIVSAFHVLSKYDEDAFKEQITTMRKVIESNAQKFQRHNLVLFCSYGWRPYVSNELVIDGNIEQETILMRTDKIKITNFCNSTKNVEIQTDVAVQVALQSLYRALYTIDAHENKESVDLSKQSALFSKQVSDRIFCEKEFLCNKIKCKRDNVNLRKLSNNLIEKPDSVIKGDVESLQQALIRRTINDLWNNYGEARNVPTDFTMNVFLKKNIYPKVWTNFDNDDEISDELQQYLNLLSNAEFAPTPKGVKKYVKDVLMYMKPEQFNEFLNKIPQEIAALPGKKRLKRNYLIRRLKKSYSKSRLVLPRRLVIVHTFYLLIDSLNIQMMKRRFRSEYWDKVDFYWDSFDGYIEVDKDEYAFEVQSLQWKDPGQTCVTPAFVFHGEDGEDLIDKIKIARGIKSIFDMPLRKKPKRFKNRKITIHI